MPYVNIRLVGTLTNEQKQQIAAKISDTIERVAQKSKAYTYITFDEVSRDNWAIGGQLLGGDKTNK